MMMKNKLVLTFFLAYACAWSARAESVTAVQAAYAASAWAKNGTAMGRKISENVVDTATYAVTNGYSFYAVKMDDGSTVFTSSDDEFEPIIAFTSNPQPNLSPKSPLRDLLDSDVRIRALIKEANRTATTTYSMRTAGVSAKAATTVTTTRSSAAKSKWSTLLSGMSSRFTRTTGSSLGKVTTAAAGKCEEPATSIDDVRVAPLLKTKWSQSEDNDGNYLYNYYTTNHYACGCTATAAGQIMCYFRYPTASMPENVAYDCEVGDDSKHTTPAVMYTQGGVYDWDLMVGDGRDVNDYNTEEQRQAIGKLLSDIGIVLESSYTDADGTGALTIGPPKMFRSSSFGYANAYLYTADPTGPGEGTGGLHNEAARKRCIYTNLDAKRPVQLSIGNYYDDGVGGVTWGDGHSVVGDGYGYKTIAGEPVPYVHINLGWAGQDDAWYNLPEVDAKTTGSKLGQWGLDFKILSGCVFNISTNDTGDILSGRVTDDEGVATANITVKAYQGSTLKATTQTDAKGIYAFTLPGGKHYRIVVELGGIEAYEIADVELPKTTRDTGGAYLAYYIIQDLANVGNSWGNDIVMGDPCVRNVTQGGQYSNLNLALTAASDGDVIEVFAPAPLKRNATISKNVTIFSADPEASPVSRVNDAALTVASGVTLTLSNIVFATSSVPSVRATVGGKVALAGKIGLGELATSDSTGLILLNAISPVGTLLLNCPACCGEDAVFGTATCDLATAILAASNIVNGLDVDLSGSAKDDSGTIRLYWANRPVDPDTALVYATGWYRGEENVTTYFNSFTKLFKDYTNGAEIVVRNDATIGAFASNLVVEIVKPTIIRGDGGTKKVFPNLGSSFRILAGGTLGVTNIIFDGSVQTVSNVVTGTMRRFVGGYYRDFEYTVTNVSRLGWSADGNGQFFYVDGGELTLGDNTTVRNFTTSRKSGQSASWSTSPYGATLLVDGTLTLGSGAKITACNATGNGYYGINGGGIAAVGGQLNLRGGTIQKCSAHANGGAVFVGKYAHVRLEGKTIISGNTGANKSYDDLYFASTNVLPVVGVLTSGANVGFRFRPGLVGEPFGGNTNSAFAVYDCDLSSATADCELMFNNALDEDEVSYRAAVDSATGRLFWQEVKPTEDGQCAESVAGVRVKVDGESNYRWYSCIDDAFEYVKADATFEVKGFVSGDTARPDAITKDVTIDHDVRIKSWAGYPYHGSDIMILWRTCHAMYKVVAGGSLTLSNVKLVGACSWDDGDEDPWDDDPSCPFTPLFYEDADPENPVDEPSKGLGLISVDGGSLTLEDGARVGFVFGNMSRASNAITVFNGGTVTMESGSRVMQVDNQYTDDYEVSCGGGILLDRSTGYFRGGAIYNCKAYRAGGLYVANESTAYVSGDLYIDDNESWKRLFEQGANTDLSDNVVVSKNSKLVLAGPLESVSPWSEYPEDPDSGSIGVNESIAGDTNWFGYVSADWNWDYDTLTNSAAYFRHDKRSETLWTGTYICGTAVTNWNEKTQRWDARLVWEDSLSLANGITIDSETYRSAIPAGMSVATPQAFSVTPTMGANGKQVLSLEGGVEGCWYTVYSTTDLTTPFTTEASVQLKPGETFEYEVDQTKESKFYKVVAEEGLK